MILMKKILRLLTLLVLVSCKSKQPTTIETVPESKVRFVKINFNEVALAKKNRAFDLGKRLLETCNTSRFKTFSSEEATAKVIQNATVENISKTCQKILHRNGKFIDLELIEIIQDTESDDLLFKFKIEYEKKYFQRQLNVTVNSEGKVSAISTKELPKKPM